MPERKPSTSEGRSLKKKVNSKDVKLKRNKIVEKTITGKKKTIQRKGNPVKTVEVKKVKTTKSPILKKKSSSSSMKGFKAATTAGVGAGAATGYKMAKNATTGLMNKYNQRVSVSQTIPSNKNSQPQKYTGSRNSNAAMGKVHGAAGGAIVGGVATALGYSAVKAIKKGLSKGRIGTERQRTVNGVNKTAQRKNVSTQMKTMRSKRRGSKR